MNKSVPQKILDLLKSIVEDGIENYSIIVQNPTKRGDGFNGELHFITLQHRNNGQVLDFAIKQAFTDEEIRIRRNMRSYFMNEIYFYEKIWPTFEKFQVEQLSSKIFDKIPKCYGTSSEINNEVIVLENLRHKFKLIDKVPLDNGYFEFIFKQYGRLHAISYAYKQLNPGEYSKLSQGLENMFLMQSQKKSFRNYFRSVFEHCLESLNPVDHANVIEKYMVYIENGADIYGATSVYNGNYSVVLHGDSWSNNMMFKYDEFGKPTDFRLLDFQFTYQGSPVSDLSYCLYTSGSRDTFDQLDYYLKMYHDSLTQTLKEVGCDSDVYPFEELKKEWKQYSKLGFASSVAIWHNKLLDEMDTMNSRVGEGDTSTKLDEERFRRIVRDIILHMYENDCL